MSGFSSELIDYLEGRITFEEFDRRRDERKAEVRQTESSRTEPEPFTFVALVDWFADHICLQESERGEDAEEDAQPCSSAQILSQPGNMDLLC